jgi:Na+-driven multidrug efflux pump
LSPGRPRRGQRPGADLSGNDGLSYPAAAIALIGSGALRGAGNTKIPLLINGGMNILNIIISSVLIYGIFSWPGWGSSAPGWG